MASLLFKEMKGLNFSCTSPASTAAICATIEGRSAISSGVVGGGGGRAIDRYNPHLRDPRRSKAAVVKPALLPQAPNSSKTSKYKNSNKKSKKKSSQKPADTNLLSMSSPGSSSRFLLNRDITFSDHVFAHEPDHVLSSVVSPPPPPPPPPPPSSSLLQLEMISRSHHQSPDRNYEPSPTSSSSSSSSAAAAATATTAAAADITADVKPQNQVVVLRVSLHCKGCEGKVRKHISKMKGVKSFSIDFAAKKVTVIGDVTPLGVLNSISKVKSAQFWPSPGDSQNLF